MSCMCVEDRLKLNECKDEKWDQKRLFTPFFHHLTHKNTAVGLPEGVYGHIIDQCPQLTALYALFTALLLFQWCSCAERPLQPCDNDPTVLLSFVLCCSLSLTHSLLPLCQLLAIDPLFLPLCLTPLPSFIQWAMTQFTCLLFAWVPTEFLSDSGEGRAVQTAGSSVSMK